MTIFDSNDHVCLTCVFSFLICIGLLRRCFSQQCEVRAAAYAGLGSLSERYDVLSGDVFEILYTQVKIMFDIVYFDSYSIKDIVFFFFFSFSEVLKPTKVWWLHYGYLTALKVGWKQDFSNLSIYFWSIYSRRREVWKMTGIILVRKDLYIWAQWNLNSIILKHFFLVITEALATFKNHLKSLTFRLTKLDIEDYELDKTTNFDTTTSTGLRSSHIAEILLGTFDIIMEHEFISQGDTMESCQVILTLFKKRKALLTLLKDNISKDKGKK